MSIAREPRDHVVFNGASGVSATFPTASDNSPARLLGALIRSAQMAVSMRKALDMTVQYATERLQFGRPIAKFQAIQHYLAIIAGEYAAALAITGAAEQSFIRSVEKGQTLDMLPIASAKVRTGEAANIICSLAHQIHGAIGFTEEYILHRFTHRLWSWRNDYGTESEWAVQLGNIAAKRGADEIWSDLTAN